MSKRYDTVSKCPWCGGVPEAGSIRCSCGLVLPRRSDFEFGLKYYAADGDSDHNIKRLFGKACYMAVNGEGEDYIGDILKGKLGLDDPAEWLSISDGFNVVEEAANRGFKWAKFCLGYFYFHGSFGKAKDYAKAKSLILAAGNTKEDPIRNHRAFQHLCMCLFDGVGGFERDVDNAIYWLSKLRHGIGMSAKLYYQTIALLLNRTDLCRTREFKIETDGIRWRIQKDILKKMWTVQYKKLESEGVEVQPLTFMPQIDERQLGALLNEAVSKYGKYYTSYDGGKIGAKYRLLTKKYWPGSMYEDEYENMEIFLWKFRYYDTVFLKHSVDFDHFLFADLDSYFKKLANVKYIYKYYDRGTLMETEKSVPIDVGLLGFFKYIRRYILSDRKAGVVLWDGSIQKEVNSRDVTIPRISEGVKKQRQQRELAKEKERKEAEAERIRNEIARKKEEAEQKRKERAETRQGCGCLLAIIALVCLVIWGPEWLSGNIVGDVLGKVRGLSWTALLWVWAVIVVIAKFAWHHWIISGIVIAVLIFKSKS